jgi:hypothetical protein
VLASAPGSAPNPDAAKKFTEGFQHFIADQQSLLAEVKRLYEVLESFKRAHMPLAGEPGAPAVCTSCSMHGGQVPWPCEIYRVASRALPDRKP